MDFPVDYAQMWLDNKIADKNWFYTGKKCERCANCLKIKREKNCTSKVNFTKGSLYSSVYSLN